jgi:hypothetical protein
MRRFVSKSTRYQSEQKLLTNISVVLGTETLDADGKKYDAAAVKGLVQPRLDATAKVEATHLAFSKAVKEERAALAASHDELALVREALLVKYRSDVEKLGSLGITPRKTPKKPTVDTKAKAVGKAKATRARHAPALTAATPPPAPTAPPVPAPPPAPVKPPG